MRHAGARMKMPGVRTRNTVQYKYKAANDKRESNMPSRLVYSRQETLGVLMHIFHTLNYKFQRSLLGAGVQERIVLAQRFCITPNGG